MLCFLPPHPSTWMPVQPLLPLVVLVLPCRWRPLIHSTQAIRVGAESARVLVLLNRLMLLCHIHPHCIVCPFDSREWRVSGGVVDPMWANILEIHLSNSIIFNHFISISRISTDLQRIERAMLKVEKVRYLSIWIHCCLADAVLHAVAVHQYDWIWP